MSKLKHTPGPWKAWGNGDLYLLISPDKASVSDICHLHLPNHIDECEEHESNARLIAAAPEMLIELLKSVAELDKTGFASVKAETLIMKVTGWDYEILNDVLSKLATGLSIEEVLSE